MYKLSRVGTGWVLNDLYNFTAHNDGAYPDYGGLTFGPGHVLYGTSQAEGDYGGGNIFTLMPPATFCSSISCFWNITPIYAFQGGSDGEYPNGKIVFDAAGNLYGTTTYGGASGDGTVFMATRSGGSWTETVLYSFGTASGPA